MKFVIAFVMWVLIPAGVYGGGPGQPATVISLWVPPIAAAALRQSFDRQARRVVSPESTLPGYSLAEPSQRRHSTKKATLIGPGAGAVLGFLAGRRLETTLCEWQCPAGSTTVGFTALGAAGGGIAGFLVGRR